jgi:hypothetical protein
MQGPNQRGEGPLAAEPAAEGVRAEPGLCEIVALACERSPGYSALAARQPAAGDGHTLKINPAEHLWPLQQGHE